MVIVKPVPIMLDLGREYNTVCSTGSVYLYLTVATAEDASLDRSVGSVERR